MVVDKARTALGFLDDEECFFRGHSNIGYELLPTLQRRAKELDWDDTAMRAKEDAFFWEFQARAHDLHGLGFDDWDYLFAMRHYGVPTRLLDWTESFAVALYFAVHGANPATSTPCIWVLNPYALNEDAGWGRDLVAPRYLGWEESEDTFYTYGDMLAQPDDLDWSEPVAIYPLQRLSRMRAQRGWFTIHGTDERPMETIAPDCLLRIDFDGHSVADTQRLLTLLGLDRFTIYTDLDSLAEAVTTKNLANVKPRPR